jgi:hypothetical protein
MTRPGAGSLGRAAAIFPRLSYRAGGIVIAMATKKITVTLAENQLDQIRDLVRVQTASSVSGFVQHAVTVARGPTAY